MSFVDRSIIKKYFYGTKGPLFLGIFGTIIAFMIGKSTGRYGSNYSNGFKFALAVLICAIIWSLIEKFGMKTSQEQAVDACIKEDLVRFRDRALQKIGIVDEQISIIEPIKVTGPYYEYKEVKVRRSIFTLLFRAIYNLFVYKPRLIFKYGSDEKVRYSMVQAHIFFFSESQIYVYEIDYDVCTGDIFEEKTAEYFYRDIDCVITGEKTEKVISQKQIINKKFEYFKVIVTSGTNTYAYADGENSILLTQVMAMRSLIRSKKEEGMNL